jgi:nicotinate-nucleotide adenylyltransferase
MVCTRVGLFGGTFDPIHVGHLVVAVNARYSLRLDRVLLVVADQPWQKTGDRVVTASSVRFEMVRAAVEGIEGLEASSVEIERGGPTYTADTLAALAAEDPSVEWFLIVGSDVAGQLHTWKRPDEIRERATLAIVNRPGSVWPTLERWRTESVEIPPLEISSRDLRDRVARGLPIDFLVPAAAIHCIREHNLYASGR